MKYLAPLLALKGCELYVTTEIKGVQAHFNVGEYRGPDSIVYMDADLFAGRAGEKLIAIQKILDGKTMDDTDAV